MCPQLACDESGDASAGAVEESRESELSPTLRAILDFISPFVSSHHRWVTLGCLLALSGCGGGERVQLEGTVRDGHSGSPLGHAWLSTDDGQTAETDAEGHFSLSVEEGSDRPIHVSAAGRCDVRQEVDIDSDGTALEFHLFSRLEVEEHYDQVGFDQEVEIRVNARCDASAPITWTQRSGPQLGTRMTVRENGHVLVVRTHPLLELVTLDPRPAVVAFDRHERGDYRLTMEAELGGETFVRQIRITAGPTSPGIFQVPTGTDVYLSGGVPGAIGGRAHGGSNSGHPGAGHPGAGHPGPEGRGSLGTANASIGDVGGGETDWDNSAAETSGWFLLLRPDESRSTLSDQGTPIAHFRPDQFGTYLVEHRPSRVQFNLQAGPYENVPRDCGRAGCHVAEAETYPTTAHSETFRRGVGGELGQDFDERCWACHATGVEPGVQNGGLLQTAQSIGWPQPEPGADVWSEAPRQIRRHGSVWCSACHGPGRIVPPAFRWQYGAKFQVGVCARCHDVDDDDPAANHVSSQVDEWRLSVMAHSAANLQPGSPALRSGCARCHSAQGFVAWRDRGDSITPDPSTVASLTCATCHDPHEGGQPAALRVYDETEPVAGQAESHLGAGALCVTCHRTGVAGEVEADRAPHAPQADMLLGRGASLHSRELRGPHADISNACVRCHMRRPDEGDPARGVAGGHTFSTRALSGTTGLSEAACAPCHGEGDPEEIGRRDWDGDGEVGTVAAEYGRSLRRLTERLNHNIEALRLYDRCSERHQAQVLVERDARILLADSAGILLGDCDNDREFSSEETAMSRSALPASLSAAAYDLSMLAADGSAGRHNPAFAFAMFRTLSTTLH